MSSSDWICGRLEAADLGDLIESLRVLVETRQPPPGSGISGHRLDDALEVSERLIAALFEQERLAVRRN